MAFLPFQPQFVPHGEDIARLVGDAMALEESGKLQVPWLEHFREGAKAFRSLGVSKIPTTGSDVEQFLGFV